MKDLFNMFAIVAMAVLLIGCGSVPVTSIALCSQDSDCGRENAICVAQVCISKIVSSGCKNDADCKANQACSNSKCVEITDCTDGETRECYTGHADTKGKGTCKAGTQECKNQTWGTCTGEVLPSKEVCGDSKDNNCDGNVDENLNCGCKNGDNRACYTGDPSTRKKGTCQDGTQECKNNIWGPCNGEVLPQSSETCDGKDNNCDGQVDENIPPKTCYTGPAGTEGKGSCKGGQQICENGKLSECRGQVLPAVDLCNGKDDDCNGTIDDKHTTKGLPCTKTLSNGCTSTGTWVCTKDGSGTVCDAPQVNPTTEICDNNKDDDCNGKIDDGPTCAAKCTGTETRPCYTDSVGCTQDSTTKKWTCKGVCQPGTQTCNNGTWSTCMGAKGPGTETCDGKDNNCDGQVDENTDKICTTKCGVGKEVCSNGTYQACNVPSPTTETCNNKDDDCNGSIDDGLNRNCTTACGTGTETCRAGKWEGCTAPQPQTETCNNKDDDCNGKIDDGVADRNCTNSCGTGKQSCSAGQWSACTPAPTTETCNGKDDDCNGKIDDGLMSTCPQFVKVTMKQATLGSQPNELGHNPDGSQMSRTVTWSYTALYAGVHEITQEQFKSLMGYITTQWGTTVCTTNCPVNRVTWHEAAAFANALSTKHGVAQCYTCSGTGSSVTCTTKDPTTPHTCKGYRLPTQSESEYLARGGTTGATYCTVALSVCAWYSDNSNGDLHPVGQKMPNAYGMYDTVGNVIEWTYDGYQLIPPSGKDPVETTFSNTTQENRVIRGCSISNIESGCNVAKRYSLATKQGTLKLDNLGFRLVRTAP